ncbi:MAG: 2-amino-4-hydroxy-6-hydroxymethyldihydropteridine diphosphokinase [Sulfurimonas sp.]|nr:2-amino-4-hydroxy-6-hydroxymethyldihydropteridine diphosphokinase [Sulfurimonas sp.]
MYLKRELTNSLTTFKSLCFNTKNSYSNLRYKVTIGIGGNIGDVKRRFNHLEIFMKKDKRVDVLRTSLILKNPPFGFIDQDDFFNSILVLQTNMQPRVFLDYLMRVEKRFGRQRSFENAPRTLDLDIIFFDNRIIKTNKLTIPHASWSKRQSVVIPLASLR